MFGSIKDSLASGAAKALLAGRIERYGRLLDLRIRSRAKTLSAVIQLAGETEEVRIEVGRYQVTGESGNFVLVIEEVTASREWLQLLLEDFLVGKPLPVPGVAILALGGPGA
jgi:hypothetical protein